MKYQEAIHNGEIDETIEWLNPDDDVDDGGGRGRLG
jgi:hypothetical protein